MSSIGGAGGRPRVPREVEVERPFSEAAESEAAAIEAEPQRTSIRWFDFKDMKKVDNVRFLRDGGSATFEGRSLGYGLAFRYDGAIRSPTRGQVFVKSTNSRGGERPLNENERTALAKQLEKLAKGGAANKEELKLLVDRLKSSEKPEPVGPPNVRIPEKVREAVFTADSGRFPGLGNQPDRQFVAVDAAKKRADGGYDVTLATYRTSIAGPIPGNQGKVEGSERTYRYSSSAGGPGSVELVKPPAIGGGGGSGTAPVKVKNLTTERIVHMGVNGDTVRIGIGIGAGFTARGGVVGLNIDGKDFKVETKRGDSSVEKVKELKAKIEAGGYKVTEERLRGIDTVELSWKIERAEKPPEKSEAGLKLAADVERMLRGKVTPREREKLRGIATSIPIIRPPGGGHGPRFPPNFHERLAGFGDMIVKLREDKKLYDFMMAVAEMQLERHPPIPAGPTIDYMKEVVTYYGLDEAKKALEASLRLPDDWPAGGIP